MARASPIPVKMAGDTLSDTILSMALTDSPGLRCRLRDVDPTTDSDGDGLTDLRMTLWYLPALRHRRHTPDFQEIIDLGFDPERNRCASTPSATFAVDIEVTSTPVVTITCPKARNRPGRSAPIARRNNRKPSPTAPREAPPRPSSSG
jgi:hypothetical protein